MSASQRQEFCVRWNSHLGSIGASFPQLLAGQRFVDVTLACEGHQVHCHRLVLAACSSYFESILAENPCKHPVVILPSEIKLWEIQALVDFMYKGEVNVTQAGLPQLLRCAEQLRIKGLYGSDAALNLNQLKALTNKVAAAAAAATGLTGGNGGVAVINDGAETDDTGTNSTTTTTSTNTASSTLLQQQQQQNQQQQQQQQQHQQLAHCIPADQLVKKELTMQHHTNGMAVSSQSHQHQQQHHQQMHYQTKREMRSMNVPPPPPPIDDESADDSTSNTYDQYDDCGTTAGVGGKAHIPHPLMHLDTTIEDDHNYVAAHDEDDSYGAADTEHETSANSSALMHANAADVTGTFKRVRRSEASLAQAAKCVSKGQTFQTVSNMFNIPVSTIRFYMARKGILPKRKRGRGASTANSGTASAGGSFSNAVMTQALAQMKRDNTISPKMETVGYHAAMGYKLNDKQGAAHMI